MILQMACLAGRSDAWPSLGLADRESKLCFAIMKMDKARILSNINEHMCAKFTRSTVSMGTFPPLLLEFYFSINNSQNKKQITRKKHLKISGGLLLRRNDVRAYEWATHMNTTKGTEIQIRLLGVYGPSVVIIIVWQHFAPAWYQGTSISFWH